MDWYTKEEVAKEAKRRKRIPDKEFKVVLDWGFVPTVDFIVTRTQLNEREFLLVLRNEEPWKGEFFVPGGRIFPGMTSQEALKVNCQRELGFQPIEFVNIGEMSVFNPSCSSGEHKCWFSL